jgi:hypothetical protein
LLAIPGAQQLGSAPVSQVIADAIAWSEETLAACGAPAAFNYGNSSDPFAVLAWWATVDDEEAAGMMSAAPSEGEGLTGRRLLFELGSIFGPGSGKHLAAAAIGAGMGFIGGVAGSAAQAAIITGMTGLGTAVGGPVGSAIGMAGGVIVGIAVSTAIAELAEAAGEYLVSTFVDSDDSVLASFEAAAELGGMVSSIRDFGVMKQVAGKLKPDVGYKIKEALGRYCQATDQLTRQNDEIARGLDFAYTNADNAAAAARNQIKQFNQNLPNYLRKARELDKKGRQEFGRALGDLVAPYSTTAAKLVNLLVGDDDAGSATGVPQQPDGDGDASGSSGTSGDASGSGGIIGDASGSAGTASDASGSDASGSSGAVVSDASGSSGAAASDASGSGGPVTPAARGQAARDAPAMQTAHHSLRRRAAAAGGVAPAAPSSAAPARAASPLAAASPPPVVQDSLQYFCTEMPVACDRSTQSSCSSIACQAGA